MTSSITVFRHMLDNDMGTLAGVFAERGDDITVIDTFDQSLEGFDPLAPDLLVVMGGACGVYQDNLYPFLKDETNILKARLAADKPTLGICLGAQLMASALGSQVFKGSAGKEIGWQTIDINEAGMAGPIRHFEKSLTRVMQWHGDTFDLPDDAVLLGSSERYAQQVFQWGRNAMAFQCHIEVDRKTVRSWLVNEAYDADKGQVDLFRIGKDTDHWADVMKMQTRKFMHEWLEQVGL